MACNIQKYEELQANESEKGLTFESIFYRLAEQHKSL